MDLVWRPDDASQWQRTPMRLDGNDRWTGAFVPPSPGPYQYAIEAWTDVFGTWRRDFIAKQNAGLDVSLERQEGRQLLADLRRRRRRSPPLVPPDENQDDALLLSDDLLERARRRIQSDLSRSQPFPLYADRARARWGAWYEMVPRSQGRIPGRHGTFDDCIARLPEIAGLGFDVVYLTPIHPIGRINRKGRNNALKAAPGDPGSPYAIGAAEGGHDAVHPELGTLADFRRFVRACTSRGMEVALDFAVNAPPIIRGSGNIPTGSGAGLMDRSNMPRIRRKKYEDIVNPDFYGPDRAGLWRALRDVVLFWVEQGVRIFRVDNPHTKPFPFWEWMIREVQTVDPTVIFLAEAFTRPKVMKALAKLGFSQSYTYFTWRTTKEELQAYLSEITRDPEREYFRPNFFTNTPDILPFHLQSGEPSMFKARVALAATLSGNYGIDNGFELLEHDPIPGKEEYLDSEKYEVKVRDWDKPGNIKSYIGSLNALRRSHAAFQQTSRLRFAQVDDGEVIGFLKESRERRQRRGGRDCTQQIRPTRVLVSLRRHRNRPARRPPTRARDRRPDHRRAPYYRVGRREAVDRAR